MVDNQTMPSVELDKCADCKKPFSLGQEYWSLIYQEYWSLIYQEIALEIETLKQQLRERERDGLWSGWFWLWILIPIVLIIVCIMKVSKGSKLDSEIRDLRERIQSLERESWEMGK